MRIAKAVLFSRWAWSTVLAFLVFLVLAALDLRLKALTGIGTADIQFFSSETQFRAAFWAWSAQPYAVRAGFNLGLDYLLMPLWAASFFYSGIICAEAFTPRSGPARQWVLRAALLPLAGAICDAVENALHLGMLLNGASAPMARYAAMASNAKYVTLVVGLVLLIGALTARFGRKPKISI